MANGTKTDTTEKKTAKTVKSDNTEVKATGHDGKMAVRIVRIGNESLKEKKIKKL